MTAEEFNTLFRAHLPEISRFLARRLPHDLVEDTASELFALAWSKRDSIPKDLEFPWLIRSARYLIANQHRKDSGRARILASFQEPVAAPSAEAVALADLTLAQAWKDLADKEREVLALWAFEALEPKEIALALETSENSVNIRLSRAKKNLLANLEKNQ